jgi:bacteriophage N4 adsorption protein B
MGLHLGGWLAGLDRAVLRLLAPLSLALLASGLDDLLVDFLWGCGWLKDKLRPQARLFPPGERQLASAPRRRIAILIPLWQEQQVIEKMLEHNLAAIRYDGYHIFAGIYPNDPETQQAVRRVAERFPHVHPAPCPHDGPTSKADCLNWAFQHLLIEEELRGERFEIVVIHDAEDLIHPEELRWMNHYSARFDFIQTPVLPLATPFWALTRGLYCDEFAEHHTRDMTVRPRWGGFVPGAGVGTAFRREALEKLALESQDRIFDPESLTEDYANGLRMFRLGCRQAFIPLSRVGVRGGFMATREFFPRTWRAALRQRSRWITGIALQGSRQFGWRGAPREVYWLWRDRKGLIGNPLNVASILVFCYGLATAIWTRVNPLAARLALATLVLQVVRFAIRMGCTGRIYGWQFALGVPVRAVIGNVLNSAAVCRALVVYTLARIRGERLGWLKTDHAYPTRAALLEHKRRLGEILVGSGILSPAALSVALETLPPATRLGEHLVNTGRLSPDEVYDALSFQQGLPRARIEPEDVPPQVAHALPTQMAREWKVLPFQVTEGSLFLAGPEIPSAEMDRALKDFTKLELKFHLVTPKEFEALASALL